MKLIYSILLILIPSFIYAQIGIGTSLPNQSSALDVSSKDKGVLLPRLTLTQTEAIVDPATGLIVFCTDCCEQPTMCYYDGADWIAVATCDTGLVLPPITETDFELVAGTDPNHFTSATMPYLFDGDTTAPTGISNLRLHTFHPSNPNPNTIELVSVDTFPVGTKISVYWYNNSTEQDHLELSFSLDGGLNYPDSISSSISALSGVIYNFTVFSPGEFNAIRLRATLPPASGEMAEPYLNEILINDGLTDVTFQP